MEDKIENVNQNINSFYNNRLCMKVLGAMNKSSKRFEWL